MITGKLKVTVTKTSKGTSDYVQILSEDLTVNVVLIAEEIEVEDHR